MRLLLQQHTSFLITILLSLVVAPVSAGDTATRVLLDRMSHSHRELNYQGIFTFQQRDKMESLRMAHAVIDGEEYERLEYMDGDKREIIRRGHKLNCIHPGHQLLRFYQWQQNLKQSSLVQGGVGQYYQFTVIGTDRIAGRRAVSLEVSPKDTHRFGYRLSLDEKTGLLLRSELLDPKGQILERFQFVDISIGELIPLERFNGTEHSYHAGHIKPAADAKQSFIIPGSWMVNWLPGGFTAAVANLKFVSDDMASFTDGLTVFSVFLEKDIDAAKIATGVEGRARHGATIAYSRALLLAGHPHRVTVVGEIPPQTAQQIAQSVVLVSQ